MDLRAFGVANQSPDASIRPNTISEAIRRIVALKQANLILKRVAKGYVCDVMEERTKSDNHMRGCADRHLAPGVQINRLHHLLSDGERAQLVINASVNSPAECQERAAELTYSAEVLELWGVDDRCLETGQLDVALYRVQERLEGRESSGDERRILLPTIWSATCSSLSH